jgi:hypothetical protein
MESASGPMQHDELSRKFPGRMLQLVAAARVADAVALHELAMSVFHALGEKVLEEKSARRESWSQREQSERSSTTCPRSVTLHRRRPSSCL